MGRFSCLILLLAAIISGCASSDEASDEKEALPEKKAAPGYAATPRKSLESWATAVRAGQCV